MIQTEILVKSSLDGSIQPSLFFKASSVDRPLLVGLHTWSFDRFNQIDNMLPLAEKYDFNLLLPEFRGPNLLTNPECTYACASKYAIQDVKDAIDYVLLHEGADAENIFLLGLSGGGHMALMVSAIFPELFKAVGAYVPITDLKKWTLQNASYRAHVLACCGNSESEMKSRSPINYIDSIAKNNLKIFHGKFDTVVPFSHSMELYQKILERHPSARVFLDIFDGGHEIDMSTAEKWIISQYKNQPKTQVTG
ncbi:MAG: prolyl oligopeptidase family serine peptidase [Clostridia bacterium]|nr:prolyl oligopeptidase family serine peptidase [Clostridia bacterium]